MFQRHMDNARHDDRKPRKLRCHVCQTTAHVMYMDYFEPMCEGCVSIIYIAGGTHVLQFRE